MWTDRTGTRQRRAGGCWARVGIWQNVYRKHPAGDALASGTTMQWNAPGEGWNAGAVMADAPLNRWQTIWVGAGVVFAQVGIVGFDGQIELEAQRLFKLPEAAPAVLYACLAVRGRTREFQTEVS